MNKFICMAASAALAFAVSSPLAAASDDIDASIVENEDGSRTLIHEAVIDAPVSRVWASFTTQEGWKNWGPKFARIDLRQGGTIESSYHADTAVGDPRNILHRIIAMVPERMIAMRLERVPEGGPVSEEVMAATWVVYELEPAGEARTRLRILGLGYQQGEEFDRVIGFFHSGNAYSIELLRKNLATSQGN
ncbi:MAG: SRPBCC domain-containing protein [Sphingomonadales bacterium]|nr:MAG: SRPBCC domain-containing protein [Sphingomonadales bacterium]